MVTNTFWSTAPVISCLRFGFMYCVMVLCTCSRVKLIAKQICCYAKIANLRRFCKGQKKPRVLVGACVFIKSLMLLIINTLQ
jgi:hypothetical protein